MMNKRIFTVITFLLCFMTAALQAQFSTEAGKKELEKRGLTEQEVRDALTAKGIDVNNINTNDPAELAQYEKTIREVLNELEKQKKEKTNVPGLKPTEDKKPVEDTDKPVKIALKDDGVKAALEKGATLDEAINEELSEAQQKLVPPASVYGHHIFRDRSIKHFRTTEGAKVPPTYRLGPGDVVNINIWGDTEYSFSQEISDDGYIKPDKTPRIFLSGLTIAEAKKVVTGRMRQYRIFSDNEIAVTLATARTISVNIVGDVFNPGSYTVSALNTAINALVAAGGPNDLGSVRNIKLLSPGKGETNIDIYQYLTNPLVNENYYLTENDYIYVPVAKKVVEVLGGVNRPLKYELKEGENLQSLLNYAGGLLPNALKKNIQIVRVDDDRATIIDVDYSQASSTDFVLKHGDVITVKIINTLADNFVNIQGAVENPGTYEYRDGLKIVDVLRKAVLKVNAIKDIVYIRRLNSDLKSRRYEIINITEALADPASVSNIDLAKGDEIIISSQSDYVDNFNVIIEGAVRTPDTFALDASGNLKVSDLLFLAGGLDSDAADFGYIHRRDPENINKLQFLYFELPEILKDEESSENLMLMPEDKVIIYAKRDFIDEESILVEGAVRSPGEIPYNAGLNLRDAILLSGGLRREASNSRVEIYRITIDNDKQTKTLIATVSVSEKNNYNEAEKINLMPYDQIFIRTAPEFELQQNVVVTGEVKYPGKYALLDENTRLSVLIRQAGFVTDEAFLAGATLKRKYFNAGYVIIDLKSALSNPGSEKDIILREGDEIYIPKRNTLVTISGATNAKDQYLDEIVQGKINVTYEGNKSAGYYLEKFAGGISDEGDPSSVIVEYPNGSVKKTRSFLFWKIYPKVTEGSHIKVSKKAEKTPEEKEKKDIDWGDVLSDSITQATAILSLVLLLRSLD